MVVRIPIVALAALAVVVLLGPGRAADAPAAPAAAPAAAGYAGADVCATCHGDVVTALAATAHGKTHVTDWDGGAACETCHGPGAATSAKPPIIIPFTTKSSRPRGADGPCPLRILK